jgi:hypothetical protein
VGGVQNQDSPYPLCISALVASYRNNPQRLKDFRLVSTDLGDILVKVRFGSLKSVMVILKFSKNGQRKADGNQVIKRSAKITPPKQSVIFWR